MYIFPQMSNMCSPGIHIESQKWRFSARTKDGKEYLNPVTGETGTRNKLGYLDLNPH